MQIMQIKFLRLFQTFRHAAEFVFVSQPFRHRSARRFRLIHASFLLGRGFPGLFSVFCFLFSVFCFLFSVFRIPDQSDFDKQICLNES